MDARQQLKVSNTQFTISLATLSDAFFNTQKGYSEALWDSTDNAPPSDEELLEALRKDAKEFLSMLLRYENEIEEDWCEYLAQDFLRRL